jgi:hypothetical protein
MKKLTQLSTVLVLLTFTLSCYLAAIYLRINYNDGSRAAFHLLDHPKIFFEQPYRRVSNVIAQWPYLIYANINPEIKIRSALEWISFSYSFFPFIFIIFFGVWGWLKRDYLWWWMTFSLLPFTYLPQAVNHFNTVTESAFVFIVYMFIDSLERNKKNFFLKVLLLISFYLSHEISVLYCLVIFLLPFLKKLKMTTLVKAEVFISFFTFCAILITYCLLPPQTHVFLTHHFSSYFNDLTVWLNHLALILLFIYPVVSKKVRILLNMAFFVLISYLLFFVIRYDVDSSKHYFFRLLTSYFAVLFFIVYYKRPNLFQFQSSKILILMLTLTWTLRDIKFSLDYRLAQIDSTKYLKDKTGCIDEKDFEVTRTLAKYAYVNRSSFVYSSLTLSPSFEKPHIIFLTDYEKSDQPSCPSKTKDSYTISGEHVIWFPPNGKFNIDSL